MIHGSPCTRPALYRTVRGGARAGGNDKNLYHLSLLLFRLGRSERLFAETRFENPSSMPPVTEWLLGKQPQCMSGILLRPIAAFFHKIESANCKLALSKVSTYTKFDLVSRKIFETYQYLLGAYSIPRTGLNGDNEKGYKDKEFFNRGTVP